jgi:uncharacterized protein (DUF2141 family)
LFLLSFADCAKKGTPSGGARDTIAPIIIKSSPENYSTNFTGNEVRVYFNEYIKLKDLQRELIISPPLKTVPLITPLSASKILKIKILDTLKENTTYSFNFGNSIVDNNEGNPYEYFKYVFSTGSYIDSLKLSGIVRDAQLIAPEIPTSLLLHEINEEFNDSLVFSEKPTYITTTKDSTGTFEFTNLKEGNYLLVALKEKNIDYTFQPVNDKIGFVNSEINLPTDSTYVLTLFKESSAYGIGRPKQAAKNHISFGYEGDANDLSIKLISPAPEDFEAKTYRDVKSDTLHYWFKPSLKADSLLFVAKNYERIDTLNVRIRDLYKDSLKITSLNRGILTLKDTLKVSANTPLIAADSKKLRVINKDSVAIEAFISIDTVFNLAKIIFPKTEEQAYRVQLLPGALTDFYSKSNDTLNYTVATKAISDYGTLALNLTNVREFPIIVQLVNTKFEVLTETYLIENRPVFFDFIAPGNYYLRIVYDTNENHEWDSGNFLERKAPEKIVYYPTNIEVRGNWSLNETFNLD